MSIGRICCREVDTATIDEPVRFAAQRMGSRNVGTLVVTGADREVLGILTDRDVAVRVAGQGLDPDSTSVADVMTSEVHTAFEEMPIEEALGLMRTETVRRLVVVNRDGVLQGIVSVDDILMLVADELNALGGLLRKEDPSRTFAAS